MTIIRTDAEERWGAALDELEASIERFADLALTAYGTADGPPEVPPAYVLPDDLGPVPASLRERAEELAGRSDSVMTELHRVRDVIGAQMIGQGKVPTPHAYRGDHEARYLDTHG